MPPRNETIHLLQGLFSVTLQTLFHIQEAVMKKFLRSTTLFFPIVLAFSGLLTARPNQAPKISLAAENAQTDFSRTVANCLRSSLCVYTEFKERDLLTWKVTSALHTGGAFLYAMDDNDAFIVTNYHVVYSPNADFETNGGSLAKKINCYLYGSVQHPIPQIGNANASYAYGDSALSCEYVGGSLSADLAVLRADSKQLKAINGSATPVTLAKDYRVGETAIAIGNTEGLGISVTKGIVSVENEPITLAIDGATARQYRSMRIDTPIYSGNSGGGLFNREGQLIGVTNAGNSRDQNINYAIPLPIVKNVVDNILYYHRQGGDLQKGAYRVPLGVRISCKNSKYVYDEQRGLGETREELVIDEVIDASVARKLDLEAGDRMTAITVNDVSYPLYHAYDLSDLTIALRAGDKVSVSYEREGKPARSKSYTVQKSDLILMP